jgi:hypothetical protein
VSSRREKKNQAKLDRAAAELALPTIKMRCAHVAPVAAQMSAVIRPQGTDLVCGRRDKFRLVLACCEVCGESGPAALTNALERADELVQQLRAQAQKPKPAALEPMAPPLFVNDRRLT